MASFSYGSESTTKISNSSNASSWTGAWTFAAINAIAKANIPANAIITAFTFTVYAKEQSGTFNSDIDIFFANSSNGSVKSLYSNDNCVYDSGYSTYALDLKANVQSGNANAGQIAYSSADRICVKLEKTTSLGTNRKWQCYYVAKWEYTLPTYTVTLDPNGGTVSPTSLSITGGNTYGTLPTPTRAGYTFNYWTLNGTRIYSTTAVNSSHTLVANWTVNTHTVTWKNADGIVLETDTGVAYGTTPTYNGSTPTKASTAEYYYSFSGWSPSVGAITGDTAYTAQFTATKRKYTISVSAENGSVTGGGTYEYGSSVTLTAIPNTGYKFKQWSDGNTDNPRTVTVTGDVTYTAEFESAMPEFTLVQMLYNNKQISKDNKVPAGQSFRLIAGVK